MPGKFTFPTDPYDPQWPSIQEQATAIGLFVPQSLGAAAFDGDGDEGDGDGDGDGKGANGDGGDGGEEGDGGKAGAGDGGDAGADGGKGGDGDDGGDGKGGKPAAGHFSETIDDEKHKALAGRYATPAEAIKALADTQTALNDRVKIPGKDASEEEVAKFHKAMGVPDESAGYELTKTKPEHMDDEVWNHEGTKELLEGFQNIFKTHGAPKALVDAMMKDYWQIEANAQEEIEKADKKQADDAEAALRKEWGKAYDGNMQVGKALLERYQAMELDEVALKDGTLLGSLPEFNKFIGRVGRLAGEGELQMGMQGTDAGADLAKQADELTEQIHAASRRGDNDKANSLSAERTKVMSQLTGIDPEALLES